MMKIVITIVLFFCSILVSTAQQRVEIPGSRATILIPEGTITSPHYSAMTKLDVFEMSIVEFKGNLESKFREIDSAGYVQRGIQIYETYDLNVDGYKGKIIHGNSNPAADVVQFLFGDSTFFIMASTMYTKGDKNLYEEILGYYKSIEVNETKIIDWNKFIAIEYETTNSLRLDREFINPMTILFKMNSNIENSTNTYISVQQIPNLGMFTDTESFLAQMVVSSIFSSYEVDQFVSEGSGTLNGKAVYEFSCYCISNKGEKHLVKCTARLTGDLATMVCAIVANQEDEKEVNHFFQTMKFKN